MARYTFKYASALFTISIMDTSRKRGITIRNVGPETAKFLHELVDAANVTGGVLRYKKCKQCNTIHTEEYRHCDVCGADLP